MLGNDLKFVLKHQFYVVNCLLQFWIVEFHQCLQERYVLRFFSHVSSNGHGPLTAGVSRRYWQFDHETAAGVFGVVQSTEVDATTSDFWISRHHIRFFFQQLLPNKWLSRISPLPFLSISLPSPPLSPVSIPLFVCFYSMSDQMWTSNFSTFG